MEVCIIGKKTNNDTTIENVIADYGYVCKYINNIQTYEKLCNSLNNQAINYDIVIIKMDYINKFEIEDIAKLIKNFNTRFKGLLICYQVDMLQNKINILSEAGAKLVVGMLSQDNIKTTKLFIDEYINNKNNSYVNQKNVTTNSSEQTNFSVDVQPNVQPQNAEVEQNTQKVPFSSIGQQIQSQSVEQTFVGPAVQPIQRQSFQPTSSVTATQPIQQTNVQHTQPFSYVQPPQDLQIQSEVSKFNNIQQPYSQQKTFPQNNMQSFGNYSKPYKIGMIGVLNRIGTTTQAVQLVQFFNKIGKRACYIENHNSSFVMNMKKYFSGVQYDKETNALIYENMFFYDYENNNYKNKFNVEIYDYGVIKDVVPLSFFECDMRITVCGNMAEEIERLTNVAGKIYSDEGMKFIFSFVADYERDDVFDLMASKASNTYFANYTPDCYKLNAENEELYRRIFNIVEDKSHKKRKVKKHNGKV